MTEFCFFFVDYLCIFVTRKDKTKKINTEKICRQISGLHYSKSLTSFQQNSQNKSE